MIRAISACCRWICCQVPEDVQETPYAEYNESSDKRVHSPISHTDSPLDFDGSPGGDANAYGSKTSSPNVTKKRDSTPTRKANGEISSSDEED